MSSSVKCFCILLVSLAILKVSAQERALGTWKVFMPFGGGQGVCDGGDRVYAACTKTIFSYEKETGVIQVYDKSNGLSDVDVKMIGGDMANNYVVVAYNNGNIDVIHNGTDVYNISDIKKQNTSTSVNINGLYFSNGNCYLSTDIGISVINLAKAEISNTYKIKSGGGQVKVYATALSSTAIYAATQEGVKYAPLSSPNLLDFNSWKLFGTADGLPKKPARFVETLGDKVYAVIADTANLDADTGTDTLFAYNGSNWSSVYSNSKEVVSALNTAGNKIHLSIWDNDNTTAGKYGTIDAQGTLTMRNTQGHSRPLNWFDDNGTFWESDYWNGLFVNRQGNVQHIAPDGPASAAAFALDAKDGVVNVTAGAVDESWDYLFRQGFYRYDGVKWQNYGPSAELFERFDLVSVAVNSKTGKTYFGSYFGGLVELNNANGAITCYDKTNSILGKSLFDTPRTKVSALDVDDAGNLWIGNSQAAEPIKVLTPNGQWKGFSIPYNIAQLKRFTVDRNGQVWAPLRRLGGSGLLVWSYNGTLDNTTDDKSRILSTGAGAGALPDALVHCVAEDKDGNIWVGTNQGVAVFYCGGSILSSFGCDADLIKVERDGYIGYLFGTESVRDIEVDAANRKWVGTTNGLWLISADGKTEILKFTVDNSPLPTNLISDITIDDKTGEVFIGTSGGLVSYQGDAMSECSDCDDKAIVYPNPVRPDYTGPIAIKGLVDDAYVKITDITGTLVYQGKANGTQMIWDGKGYNGLRAKSGVYTVYSSTDLGKDKKVAKILLTN